MDVDPPVNLSLRLQELRGVLTILPTVVRADESLYGVAQSFIRNPGARVISVIGARQALVGIIPVPAVTEHFLFVLAASLVLSSTPTIAESRKLGRHLNVQQAKDIMQQPSCVRVSETVGDALRLMQRRRLVGLPITDGQRRVVGYADQLELLTTPIRT